MDDMSDGGFTPEQDNDKTMTRQYKTNVEPVHSYDAFHTRSDMSISMKKLQELHKVFL